MRKLFLCILTCMAGVLSANAIDDNTVNIVYSGNSATVTIANNISSYVTVSSGTSSHVIIVQDASFEGVDKTTDNEDGEIIYNLSGTSSDGEFYLEGSYKCTVELNGVSLTNPSGAAVNIQNGKRIDVSIKKDKTSTLTDGANENSNGALHIKGHTKFKGKGTLNVVGNSKHGIYSKEYFLMESGNVSISGTGDDGIQVELDGNTSTGQMPSHEDEDSGNFYMTGGSLSIANYSGNAIKADGTINYNGGSQDFDKDDTKQYAGIQSVSATQRPLLNGIYDLQGRRLSAVPQHRCIYIIIENGVAKKIIRK